MTEKYIIAYNGLDSLIKSVVEYHCFLHRDHSLVYDLLSVSGVHDLKSYIGEKRDLTGQNPRIIAILNAKDEGFNEIVSALDKHKINEHRTNYLIYNVEFIDTNIKIFNELNDFLVGRSSFIYLFGKEDFEGNPISENKLRILIYNFLFVIAHGAFALDAFDKDPFFWQQNKRNDDDHILAINIFRTISDLPGEIFRKLLEEIQKETRRWNRNEINFRVNVLDSIYSDVIFNKEENPLPCEFFRPQFIPYDSFLADHNGDDILCICVDTYLDKALDSINDQKWKKEKTREYQVLFHNLKEKEVFKLEDSIRENTFGQFMNSDEFEFSKLCRAVDEYMKSCLSSLSGVINDIPIIEAQEIKENIRNTFSKELLKKAKAIEEWKSCKKKKRLVLAGSVVALITSLIIFNFIRTHLSFIGIPKSIYLSFFTAVIITFIVTYRYYIKGLKKRLKDYKKTFDDTVKYVNIQLRNRFDAYLEKRFLFIKEVFQKKVINENYYRLARIRSNLSMFNGIVSSWTAQLTNRNKNMGDSAYLNINPGKHRFDSDLEIEKMLSEIRKNLIIALKNACYGNETLNISVPESLNKVLFRSYENILASNATAINNKNNSSDLFTGKVSLMKEDRIPLSKNFLVTEAITKPEMNYSFILKTGNLPVELKFDGEAFDSSIGIDDNDLSCTIGFIYKVQNVRKTTSNG